MIRRLEGLDRTTARALSAWPAVKILDYYRTLEQVRSDKEELTYAMVHGLAASKTMAELAPVNKEWMNIWLDQWNFQVNSMEIFHCRCDISLVSLDAVRQASFAPYI